MNKNYFLLIAGLALLFANSCRKNEDAGAPTGQTADELLDDCYIRLRSVADELHRAGEYMGDNIMASNSTTDNFSQYLSYQFTSNNSRLSRLWNEGYKIIASAGEMMKKIREGESAENDQKLGEAYFMRGMMYFYLCRIFRKPYYQSPGTNPGVPLPTNRNATVQQVYERIIADLRKAEKLMTVYRSPVYVSKYAAQALLAKVYAYMSGTYENPHAVYADSCYYYANAVVKSDKFHLLPRDAFMTYNRLAPDEPSQTETIFAIRCVPSEVQDYEQTIGSMYARIEGVGRGEIYASKKLLDLFDQTGGNDYANRKFSDARAAFIYPQYVSKNGEKKRVFRFVHELYDKDGNLSGYTYKQLPITEAGGVLTAEWSGQTYILTDADPVNKKYVITYNEKLYIGVDDWEVTLNNGYPQFYSYKCSLENGVPQLHSPVVSRLAEMYLLCAEGLAKKGDYRTAQSYLNTVRERSLPGAGYRMLNADNAKFRIMEERQMELAYEADRGFDVFRVGEKMVRRYPGFYNSNWEIEQIYLWEKLFTFQDVF